MFVALLLLAELLLMVWLIWCLGRRVPPGKPRDLGLLSFKEDRQEPTLSSRGKRGA